VYVSSTECLPVVGVSGSGKKYFCKKILFPAILKHLEGVGEKPTI
jgi:excinuclease UvrABC ATPase subunit